MKKHVKYMGIALMSMGVLFSGTALAAEGGIDKYENIPALVLAPGPVIPDASIGDPIVATEPCPVTAESGEAAQTGTEANSESQAQTANSESTEDEVKAADEQIAPVEQKQVGIVLLGNPRYQSAVYTDILNRYFVKCYSRYRYPTEWGSDFQQKFYAIDGVTANTRNNYRQTSLNWPEIVKALDKDQVLFINVHDIVHRRWRKLAPFLSNETVWEAVVEVEAVLADKEGVLQKEKFMYRSDDYVSPGKAITEAYTVCVRRLQSKHLFPY